MIVEEEISIHAGAAQIFAIYADVSRWNTWDPDTKSALIEGPFEAGTRGRLAPTKGREIAITLVAVVPNRSFTVEGGIPMFRMCFEHELSQQGDITRVVHRVTFSGLLTFVLGRLIRAQLRRGLPVTLASLKRLAESPQSFAATAKPVG